LPAQHHIFHRLSASRASRYLRSAAALARFALESAELTDDHRRQLLNNAVWYVSEAAGKYKTRYRSAGVLSLEADASVPMWRSKLRHDHVTTRRSILASLASPGADVEATLRSVISCTVTKPEHERLTKFDDTCAGWDRSIAARIDVYDMATCTLFIQDSQYA
jgi:hypothetical protein